MEGWPEICIADGPLLIIDGDRGKNYPTQGDFFDSGYCLFLNAGNVTSNGFSFSNRAFVTRERDELLNKGRLRRQDSVLTTRGTVGNVAFFGNDVEYDNLRINSGMVILRPDQHKLDSYFLYLFLRSSLFDEQVKGLTSGSAQPQLPIRDIRRVRLALPPLPEQRAIAAVLSALDDKIELNRRMNETLEAMARALFRDWFVDFGPTRAKMAQSATESATERVTESGIGAKPQTALPAPYLSPALWSLFPDRLDDAGKPEGWEERIIGDIFDVTMGQSPPGSTYNEEGFGLPFFQGRRDFGFRFPSRRVYCSKPSRIAPKDWTLLSVRAPVGDINRAWEKCAIGRGVAAFMHRSGHASLTYYVGLHLQKELASYDSEGTVFGSINQKQFKALNALTASPSAANAFEAIVAPLDNFIRNNTAESRTLTQTRDLLLPRLMSGELRVAEAARAVEEVL